MPQWRKLHGKVVESLDVNDMPDDFTRLLWILLPTQLCCEGCGQDNPAWVRAKVFPLRVDVTLEMIEEAMRWFCQRKMILRYQVDGRPFFQLHNWRKYQGNTARETPSHYPPPAHCKAGRESREWEEQAPPAVAEHPGSRADGANPLQELVAPAVAKHPGSGADGTQPAPDLVPEQHPESDATRTSDSRNPHEQLVGRSRVPHEQLASSASTDADSDAEREADAEKNSGAKAPAPASPATPPKTTDPAEKSPETAVRRSAKPRPGKTKTAKSPPAVLAFRRASHRYPPKSWYGDIDTAVGRLEPDLQFWEKVVKQWVGLGWNPTNVSGMLDCYRRRQLPGRDPRSTGPPEDPIQAAIQAIEEEGWT